MVTSPFFSQVSEQITQLQTYNDMIQKSKNEELKPEIFKITTKLSIEIINDLFIEYNKSQEKIDNLEIQVSKAVTRYNKDIVENKELWLKLKEIFREAQLIWEIASRESKGLRTLPK